jgi:large subunit ribosomal protein L29
MKATKLRNMTVAEVEQQLLTLKEQMFKMRAEITTGRVERPHRFSLIRHDIARCYTILKEKSGETGDTK